MKELRMHNVLKELTGGLIAEVPVGRRYPLLELPGIAAPLQHLLVVVRLKHDGVRSPNMLLNERCYPSKIGEHHQFEPFRSNRETNRINGVVRYTERRNLNVAYRKVLPGCEDLFALRLGDVLHSAFIGIHRHAVTPA